jgi:hypothetical protein
VPDATHLDLPQTSVLALNGNIHHRLVLIGKDTGGLLQHLTVVTVLVTPLTGPVSGESGRKKSTYIY